MPTLKMFIGSIKGAQVNVTSMRRDHFYTIRLRRRKENKLSTGALGGATRFSARPVIQSSLSCKNSENCRKARPRCEMSDFSARLIAAKVRFEPSLLASWSKGTKMASQPKP